MLTRLRIKGFKSLWNVDVHFGPFTCIAGPNAVGKSNLFDAIQFLSHLASDTFLNAALSLRAQSDLTGNARDLFHRWKDHYEKRIYMSAEMIIPSEGKDGLGQTATASITFVRYALELEFSESSGTSGLGMIRLISESLDPISKGNAAKILRFPHNATKWRNCVVVGKGRRVPFISTDLQNGEIELHQERGGQPRRFKSDSLPRTVLSTVNAMESPTSLLVKREMESWRLLQLEPSALRNPDNFLTPPGLDANGAHLPATLFALSHQYGADRNIYEHVAGRLSSLINDVISIKIDKDDRRQLLVLQLLNRDGTLHEARSLSDGTLRFLALATMAEDPAALGVICMEEPENGIQPSRIPAILNLLEAIACDPQEPPGEDNPLRQVIINTHSPSVVKQINEDCLLIASTEQHLVGGQRFDATVFKWLSNTWRQSIEPSARPVAKGKLLSYLVTAQPSEKPQAGKSDKAKRRVIDRPEIRQLALEVEV